MSAASTKKTFGTAPVFFTAISTILGAILFLRFGFATGVLGFTGVVLVILLGHSVTIPTALAISEIATNEKVEGGGEYFIISRSFGLNIGGTIGFALFFSQAISVAFYIIAFTEAFSPLFSYLHEHLGIILPRQVISIPSLILLALLILKKGAGIGVKTLYLVVTILFLSLFLFFIGKTPYMTQHTFDPFSVRHMDRFFFVFAIIFPAFTGMTAGVGLSGDLKNPARSIPLGTITASVTGMIIYFFIVWKLDISASPEDLTGNQLIMANIAKYGKIVIPLGLAASTLSSAIGSILVAPRTLQALATDRSFPSRRLNHFLSRGRGETNEPFNATLVTALIALLFVAMGSINAVAQVISMFFMVTYGSICLISFLYHFGADPSYRPAFRSRWYLSLIGFVMAFGIMFKINTVYAFASLIAMTLIYLFVHFYHKDRQGVEAIFQAAFFQLNRNLQVYLQKAKKSSTSQKWRPSVVCISKDSFERDKAFQLLTWLSYRYGFGTYMHLLEGYYSTETRMQAQEMLQLLIRQSDRRHSNVYIDTLISPSYTSAIAQTIQLPGISGMENNMILFEFDKQNPENLHQIIDNYALVRAGNYDVCVLGSSPRPWRFKKGLHIWISPYDTENTNLMILLGYIITGHPDWRKGKIKLFAISNAESSETVRKNLLEKIKTGRLPISPKNIEILEREKETPMKSLVNKHSFDAGLVMLGFVPEQLKHSRDELFRGYNDAGDILFVNARSEKSL
ncbi:MAG: amino acid permease [Chlorobi bacterium]|nr:amino acid permease [Chlorobiota bacterium]